ncbi:hypothetical protein ERJ75_000559600 [Trypanosoma vivax]|nr:hypothetical protein ERJ75_000559600 [Trypanosoma vivax]
MKFLQAMALVTALLWSTACGAMADSADKHPVLEASVGKMCALAAAVKKEFGTAVEEGGWPKPLDEIVEGENISKALATARTARTLAGDSAREDRDTLEAIALAIEGLAALNATREVVSVAQGQLTLHAQAYVKSIDDCVLKLYSYKKETICALWKQLRKLRTKDYEGAQKCSENDSLGSAGLAATLKQRQAWDKKRW